MGDCYSGYMFLPSAWNLFPSLRPLISAGPGDAVDSLVSTLRLLSDGISRYDLGFFLQS